MTGSETKVTRVMEHLAPVLLLSIATSVDALAVCLQFSITDIQIIIPSLTIGIVTNGFSFTGLPGSRLRELLGKKIQISE